MSVYELRLLHAAAKNPCLRCNLDNALVIVVSSSVCRDRIGYKNSRLPLYLFSTRYASFTSEGGKKRSSCTLKTTFQMMNSTPFARSKRLDSPWLALERKKASFDCFTGAFYLPTDRRSFGRSPVTHLARCLPLLLSCHESGGENEKEYKKSLSLYQRRHRK